MQSTKSCIQKSCVSSFGFIVLFLCVLCDLCGECFYFQSEKSNNFVHYFDFSVSSVPSVADVFLSPKIPGSAKSSTFKGLSPIKS